MESLESLQSSVTNTLIPNSGQEFLTNPLLSPIPDSTQMTGLSDPTLELGFLPVELTPMNSDFITSATLQESQSSSNSVDPILRSFSGVNVNPVFDDGIFTVGTKGEVGVDFLLDGGYYQGELAIFSLEGMAKFELGSEAFIQEASRRALSDSDLGHVVISDLTEGARFHGSLGEGDVNSGIYQGVKTFAMRPGDEFGLMIVPNATVQQVFNNPFFDGSMRPLFSLSTANPNDAFQVGQIADVTGDGKTFVMEDLRVDNGSDKDYNDFIFQVRGATGKAVGLDGVIDPAKDWRGTDLGQALIEYAKPYVTPEDPKIGEVISQELLDSVLNQPEPPPSLTVPEPQSNSGVFNVGQGQTLIGQTQVEKTFAESLLEPAWKDLELIKQQQADELNQFERELSSRSNDLSRMSSNLWDEIYNAQSRTLTQMNDIRSNLDNTQTSLNELRKIVYNADNKMVGQVNSLWSEINATQNSYNTNPLRTSITSANNQMYDLYRKLWDELYPKRGNYPEVWNQVQPLYDNYYKVANAQYETLLATGNTIFNNAWSQYNSIKSSMEATRDAAWNDYNIKAGVFPYNTEPTPLQKAWGEYSTLVETYNSLFEFDLKSYDQGNVWDEYYRVNNQQSQLISDAWNDYYTLKNSWDDWVGDSEAQLQVWEKILNSEQRWYETTTNSPKVGLPLIGIIDTGFSVNNPDIDYSRITLGKDLIGGDNNPLLEPWEWWRDAHGTKMLEVIAGTRNNDISIDGINDKSPLWLGSAVGSNDWAQSLIEFVDSAKDSKQPNAVINLSFDLTQTNPDGTVITRHELTALERAALTYAQQNNVLIVTATGNQGSTMSALGQAVKEFDNIITVGAAEGWNRADYSSYGEVDYANYSKGVDILAQGNASNGASGTSVAAAKVTGAASLLWAANPNLNYTQVIDILKRTATDLNSPGWDTQTGLGLLNIAAGVHLAKATEPQVYTPPSFNLVQDTLQNSNIPEVYWPEFYDYYYYSDLEAKLTGSAWIGGVDALATERPTETTRQEKFRSTPYFRNGLPSWLPDWVTKDAVSGYIADQEVEQYKRTHPLPTIDGVPYAVYEIEDEPLRWSGRLGSVTWGGIKKVILVTNQTLKDDLTKKKKEKDAAQKNVNDKKAKVDAEKEKARKDREKLDQDLKNLETTLTAALANTNGQITSEIKALQEQVAAKKAEIDQYQKASDTKIAALESQLDKDKKDLEQKTKAYDAAVAKAREWQQQELERIQREQEAAKNGFFDKLGDSVKQFSKDISEKIKSNLDGVDVGAVLDALKKIPYVGTVVNGIEGLIALAQGDWIKVVTSGINGALNLIGVSFPGKDTVVNILINVGWGIISKDYKTALKNVLKELDVKDKVANTFVDVAWAMKDGDWKDVLSAGLSGAGFSNADKFVGIAWGVKDGDYTKALTAGLEVAGLDKLGINSNQSQAFVNSAIALKDNQTSKVADELLLVGGTQFTNSSWVRELKDSDPSNDRAAVTQGLSDVGFKNVDQWVNMAWDVKDKNYLSAISTGFSLAGFSQGKDWVDMAWSLQQKDYLKALSTGFKVAGFAEGEHLAKAAVNLREGKYLDAFFEGIRIVPAVGDLINAFEAVGAGNFKGVANSLAKVATNPTLLKLLVS